jgi:hypothetical protein
LGWICAIVLYQSRFSQFWYGKRWASKFASERRRMTQLIGGFFAAGSFFLGLMYVLMTTTAAFPETRAITLTLKWGIVGLAMACYLIAISLMVRRS